jgi:hypothetical protein
MTVPHGSITLKVVSLRLGWNRSKHPEIIREAVRQTNELVQDLSKTLGPFVRLNITGPHLTYGSVTFFIVRSVIDSNGQAVFEPYEASITAHGRTEPCIVTGPLNERGQYPILITSGARSEGLADSEDLGPPLEPVRVRG